MRTYLQIEQRKKNNGHRFLAGTYDSTNNNNNNGNDDDDGSDDDKIRVCRAYVNNTKTMAKAKRFSAKAHWKTVNDF